MKNTFKQGRVDIEEIYIYISVNGGFLSVKEANYITDGAYSN